MKRAFTLAEVLITLGIIGMVAAITIPVITNKYREMVLRNQFKKTYATLFNAIKQTQVNLDSPQACFYWEKGQLVKEICVSRNKNGSCTRWTQPDGSPLPPNQNGLRTDCRNFENELFFKTLKLTKFCKNKGLANGCIPSTYKGTDIVKKLNNPDAQVNPESNFSDSKIKNSFSSFILADGTLIIKYGQIGGSGAPIYTVDINGHKGPNKWGYDIFTFQLLGNQRDGISKLNPISYGVEKGGVNTAVMVRNMHK